MPALHLIQLGSEQTMQNLLPALACNPTFATTLYNERTEAATANLEVAAKASGLSTEFSREPLSERPEIAEVLMAVDRVAAAAQGKGQTPVINFTGGTKLMSIGAFAGANRCKVPCFYLDSETSRFIPGLPTQALPAELADSHSAFTRARRLLTVQVILKAHGHSLFSSRDPKPFLDFARERAATKLDWNTSQAIQGISIRHDSPPAILKGCNTPLPALPESLLKSAASVGLVELRNGSWFLACPERAELESYRSGTIDQERLTEICNGVQQRQTMIGGGWWEVLVWEAAQRSGLFSEVLWSAQVEGPEGKLEEDLLALRDDSLAVFSCKSASNKGVQRAVQSLADSGRRLGGLRAFTYFCVAFPMPLEVLEDVQSAAKLSHTRLVGPHYKLAPSSFA